METKNEASNQKTVVISGSHGFIGSALSTFLTGEGFAVKPLLRPQSRSAAGGIAWDPTRHTIDSQALEGAFAVLHLAGENIFGRWSREKMDRIYRSRVEPTRFLARSLAELDRKPQLILCASAVGYYGRRAEDTLTEDAPQGEGFLAGVCHDWEAACAPAVEAGIRVVYLRFGMVLGEGGALEVMKPIFKLGLGGPVGGGKQWTSWVAMEDLCRAVRFLLDCPSLSGPVNICSPNPARNEDLTRALAGALHRRAILPVPKFAVRLRFGQLANEVLLASARMIPQKLLSCGFTFHQPDLPAALKNLLDHR